MTDEQGVIDPVAGDQATMAEEAPRSTKDINFERLREKAEILERQNMAMQSRLMELERKTVQSQEKEISEDDIPTYGDIRRLREKDQQEISQLKDMISELNVRSKYSDYNDTIKEYLPDVLKEEPDLAMALQNNPMMHRLAYKLAQASPRYHQDKVAKQNAPAVEQMVSNATRAQPVTSRKNIMVQDEDAKLASMSDDQIMGIFNMAKARY